MPHTVGAGYRSGNREGCLRGTRENVLLQLEHWLEDKQGQRVFWLNGHPGTGKSTIAQTFAEIAFAEGKLGASFFCSQNFENRSNIRAIFPTLALQLAYRYPLFREQLLQVLRANPGIGRQSLCSQLEKVIVGPFKATRIPTLIVIDALDECKDEEPASAILSMLSHYVDEIPEVKFFITGRPEAQIYSGFRLEPLRPITEVFKLHDVERSSVDDDLKLFFQTRLASLAKNRRDCDLPDEWPSLSDIEILCKKAARFFIYASTVVKFVASEHGSPAERLALITSPPGSSVEDGRFEVDQLYTQILEYVLKREVEGADSEELSSNFKTVVGAVLLVFDPLSVKALSSLLQISNVSTTLHPLRSLLIIPSSEVDPVHAFHKTFHTFLTDQKRCREKRFFVDPSVHHRELLLLCLSLMKKKLKRNLCDLDDYAVLDKVVDLPARKSTSIGDALHYACRFWTKHLLGVPVDGHDVKEVKERIDEFFKAHLLSWIEVLGLTGNLDVGVCAINDIHQWYTSVSRILIAQSNLY